MTKATRYKIAIFGVLVTGTVLIVGAMGTFIFGAPLCNDKAMRPSDTCAMQEGGKTVEYTYEERSGEQAGTATVVGLGALAALIAVCVYLYPRPRKPSQPMPSPGGPAAR